MAPESGPNGSDETEKGLFPGRFETYDSYTARNLDEHDLYLIGNSARLIWTSARTKLMKEVLDEKDFFMASALRSSENFRELIKYTDGMNFKDGKAVVLYPGAGFHVAPVAEMGQQLLKKHALKEVEFVYTEIGGLPMLRDMEKALHYLIQRNGWSANSRYFQPDYHVVTDGEILENGGAFESVYKIDTPDGLITVRFKNALSGKDFYADEDLQRANFFVIHDLGKPVVRTVKAFMMNAISRKNDLDNFLVISEDFRLSKDGHKNPDDWFPKIVGRTGYPYGCSNEHWKLKTMVIPSYDPRVTPIDIGNLGLMHPAIFKLSSMAIE